MEISFSFFLSLSLPLDIVVSASASSRMQKDGKDEALNPRTAQQDARNEYMNQMRENKTKDWNQILQVDVASFIR